MKVAARRELSPGAVVYLDPAESNELGCVLSGLTQGGAPSGDGASWVMAVHDAATSVPRRLSREVAAFRRRSSSDGCLLVKGLPTEWDLPATPPRCGATPWEGALSQWLLMVMAHLLGDAVGYADENDGRLVHDIVPVAGFEHLQENSSSLATLSLHTENAFHDFRPDFVLLYCLRAGSAPSTVVAPCNAALELMSAESLAVLRQPRFVTRAPSSFSDGPGGDEQNRMSPVLLGTVEDPDLRVDVHNTRPCDAVAAAALDELKAAFRATAREVALEPGELLIVDNRQAVHGRGAFVPRYDGTDRWLRRAYAVCDIRASRHLRPEDGNVLASRHRETASLVGAVVSAEQS